MGAVLTLLGAGVVVWTVVEIFQLFTRGSAFLVLDQIVPQWIAFSQSQNGFVLPREILAFGIPIWALSVTAKIGVMVMKNGLQFLDLPRRNPTNPNP